MNRQFIEICFLQGRDEVGRLRTRPSSPPFVLHLQPRGSPRRLYSVQPVLQLLLHQVNSWRWDRLRWRERPNAKWGPRSTITVKTGRGDVMLYHAGNLCMLNSKEAWTYDKLEGESRHEIVLSKHWIICSKNSSKLYLCNSSVHSDQSNVKICHSDQE